MESMHLHLGVVVVQPELVHRDIGAGSSHSGAAVDQNWTLFICKLRRQDNLRAFKITRGLQPNINAVDQIHQHPDHICVRACFKVDTWVPQALSDLAILQCGAGQHVSGPR